jgi:hypothetical protein
MRISANLPRLRIVALGCWILGLWCAFQSNKLVQLGNYSTVMIIGISLLSLFLIAIGIAFWQLGTDKRAGVVLDAKGILLNMGNSSSFISWENIESVGITRHRTNILYLGSHRQIGVQLKDPEAYVQSYEERLPASRDPIAFALRLLDRILRPFRSVSDQPIAERLSSNRSRTGYDVLIPEALLKQPIDEVVELLDTYRLHRSERRILGALYPSRSN